MLIRAVEWIWYLGLTLVVLTVLAGFAGWVHPAGDSLSLLRMPLGALCLLGGVIAHPPLWLRMTLLGTGVAAAATTVPLWFNTQPGGDLAVYTKNVWYRNATLPALAANIRNSGAEVVMLQEVSARNDPLLERLAPAFPYQHLCRFSGWSGIAVLSVYPFVADTICSEQRGLAAARIRRGGQDIWAASIHLPWPYPYEQAQSLEAVINALDALEGPIVVAGDFNIFPWAASVRQVGQAADDVMLAGPVRPTYILDALPLMIDHVLAPGGGTAERRPLLGSDHYGILAAVHLTP